MTDAFFHWLLPGAGMALFLMGAWVNAGAMFGWSRQVREARSEGRHVSTVPFFFGVIGAVSMLNGPYEWMRAFFWLPLVLDVGCLPYLVLSVVALVFGVKDDAAAQPQAMPEGDAESRSMRVASEGRKQEFASSLTGCLLGTAVGDALGLPAEGLSPRRRARLFPDIARYHLLPFARGMCSDDTEHTIMVAQALIETAGYAKAMGNAEAFRSNLAWAMRWWLLGAPAGIGMATLKGILKLWLFLPQRWQGTYSAGNAPAMRSALIGVYWAEEPELLRLHVRAATRITHTDPKAEQAAFAVAIAASFSARNAGRVSAPAYAAHMRSLLAAEGAELANLIDSVAKSVESGETTAAFARGMGLEEGVSGYAFHTVPVALHAWLAHPGDYRQAVLAAIACGGDTDTVAAITGAIAGAGTGTEGLPPEWLARLAEWPHTVAWMQQLAQALAEVRVHYVGTGAIHAPVLRVLLRNMFFLAVVLVHGFRRLLPPY